MKMFMEIDPLSMRGSLVMMMAMISPSRREVSPAEQLRQSPRLVLPRFRLVAVEFHLRRWLMIFSHQKTPYSRIWASEGHQRVHEAGGAPRGVGRAPTLVDGGRPPSSTSFTQFFLYSGMCSREVSGLLELGRIGL